MILLASCQSERVTLKRLQNNWYLTKQENQLQYFSTKQPSAERRIIRWQFLENGELIREMPDASDRPKLDTGMWQLTEENLLKIQFPSKNKVQTLHLQKLRKNLLVLELTP